LREEKKASFLFQESDGNLKLISLVFVKLICKRSATWRSDRQVALFVFSWVPGFVLN